MAALDRALRLRRLSHALSAESEEVGASRLSFAALRQLRRNRPLSTKGLRLMRRLGISLNVLHPKLRLWAAAGGDLHAVEEPHTISLLSALKATDAWDQAAAARETQKQRDALALWNHRGRLTSPNALIAQLKQQPRIPLFFWHHYDSRGRLPRSWMAVLHSLQEQGWQVVVSSSGLALEVQEQLNSHHIPVLHRHNLGLCLGAYRDVCCLLNETGGVLDQRPQLVLANDSTLPIGGPKRFIQVLSAMAEEQSKATPQLDGMTDSIERDTYHLQSYLLMANAPLLMNSSWRQFWNRLDLNGSKDDLINAGELGLSQALLRANVRLQARHSLIDMLLDGNSTNSELARFEVREPRGINLSLYAWQALLRSGCPLIKKQVLFNLRPYPNVPIPLSELKTHLKEEDTDIKHDLEELMQSRYLNP